MHLKDSGIGTAMADKPTTTPTTAPSTMTPSWAGESQRYRAYSGWHKFVFWAGILSWFGILFWIVRLVLFISLNDQTKEKRIDAYTTQYLVFGYINVCAVALAIVICILFLGMYSMR